MEKWFALPIEQNSRKGLEIAIEIFEGSLEPVEMEVRNLGHRIEKLRLFEIDYRGVKFLDQSIRNGEAWWKFRFFRQRNELEMVVEQEMKKKEPKKVTDLKRAVKAAQKKKAG